MNPQRIFSQVCLTLLPLASVFSLAQPSNAQDNAFLWEVESPNNTVYLLGSIHLLRETDYPLAPSIQSAFDEAETVVFEIDIAEAKSSQTLQTFLQAARPENLDEYLVTALDAETYDLAEEAAARFGLPFSGFKNFEPWAFYVTLTGAQSLQLGFKPEHGIDSYLFNQASSADKEILALETIEEQFNFFDTLSVTVQANLIEQTLLELDTFETSLETMVSAWKSGDVSIFEDVVLDGFVDFPEAYNGLLVQRNQNWIPDIESFINQSEDYLVVVGAAHLVGEDSVIQLLQNKGYVVEQVANN